MNILKLNNIEDTKVSRIKWALLVYLFIIFASNLVFGATPHIMKCPKAKDIYVFPSFHWAVNKFEYSSGEHRGSTFSYAQFAKTSMTCYYKTKLGETIQASIGGNATAGHGTARSCTMANGFNPRNKMCRKSNPQECRVVCVW